MPPRLYFARHGESTANLSRTFANRGDSHPLTELGVEQAHRLAVRTRDLGISEIRTSPLLRARQTAEAVGAALGLPFVVDDGLREFDVGRWEGTSDAEGWAEYQRTMEAWASGDHAATVGDGESLADIVGRSSGLFTDMNAALERGETVLCIGHGGTYRAALPRRLPNVTHAFALGQPFPNTGWVVAEFGAEGLVCTEWCGTTPPSA